MFLVHLGRIAAHIVQLFLSDMLTQVNTLRLRCSGIVVSGAVPALTTLYLRDVIVVPPLVREGRKRSHIRRGSTCRRSSSSSSRERTKHRHKSKKKKHTSSHSSKRDKHVKKHKRKRSPSPSSFSSSVSSYSSSSQQRSPARKKSRTRSRSSSSADEIPHGSAPWIESPALSRDHLSLYADVDQFNSHSEDHQDLAPEVEIHSNVIDIHSNVSSEDMKFQNLIEEVFKLLPADRFPKKTDDVLGGNKPRSSIEMELMKAPKKSISLPQSKCPLSKTIDCIKQSLGAVETDGSYPMPPQLLRTGCLQRLILISWSSLNTIKPMRSLFPRRMHQPLTLTQIAWISLYRVLILLKCLYFRLLRVNREI